MDDERYDVCLSFAGEDRAYVEQVAKALRDENIRVFYDAYEQVALWGKDLYQHLDSVYRLKARYCVLFLSSAYAGKLWTRHELQSAQARAFSENSEYLLPARFDDTEIPGILPTVGYVDLRRTQPQELAHLIVQKVNPNRVVQSSNSGITISLPGPLPRMVVQIERSCPALATLNSSLNAPLDVCEQYAERVMQLITAGKWVTNIGVPWPPELVSADYEFLERLRAYAGTVREAQRQVQRESSGQSSTFERALGVTPEPYARLDRSLVQILEAIERMKTLRDDIRYGLDTQELRQSKQYQEAVAALNALPDAIATADDQLATRVEAHNERYQS